MNFSQKINEIKVPRNKKLGLGYICINVPSVSNVWTKYGKPRLYGNGETDLTMKMVSR